MKNAYRYLFVFVLLISTTGSAFSQSDEILFRRYLIISGWNGFYYGAAFDAIGEINGPGAAGIPVITAGLCALVPLITNSSRTVSSNTLLLTGHGQTLGWAHGASTAMIINGDEAFSSLNKSKFTIFMGAATSIGLGIVGHKLSLTKDWSEGRVAIYRHYGWAMPISGICLALTFSDDARLIGAVDLVSAGAGYLLADRVNRWNEFSRGDLRATQIFTALNGGLGLCIFLDSDPYDNYTSKESLWLLPAIGTLAGTGLSHLWLKDANLTPQQGMTTLYAAAGGAIMGLGVALIINSDNFTPYYVAPYICGVGAYTIAVESLMKKNRTLQSSSPVNQKGKWDFSFMPQNIYLNKMIESKGFIINGRQPVMQPLFAASLTF